MKSSELQKLVKSIFSDEGTKRQFESDPGSVLSRYSLSESERKAVLKVQSDLGIVASDSPQLAAAIKANYNWYSGAPTP